MTADQSFLESPLKHVISPLVTPVGNMKRTSDGVLICYPNGQSGPILLVRDCALIPCKKNITWSGFKKFVIFWRAQAHTTVVGFCASSRSIKNAPPTPPQKKKKKELSQYLAILTSHLVNNAHEKTGICQFRASTLSKTNCMSYQALNQFR